MEVFDQAIDRIESMELIYYYYLFSGMKLMQLFVETLDKKTLNREEIAKLKDTHSTSAGLKAFCTWFVHYGIDECRQV
jgi:acyl-CoA oxidase